MTMSTQVESGGKKKTKKKKKLAAVAEAHDNDVEDGESSQVKKVKKKKKANQAEKDVRTVVEDVAETSDRKRKKNETVEEEYEAEVEETPPSNTGQKKHKLGKRERVRAAKERDRVLAKQTRQADDIATAKAIKESASAEADEPTAGQKKKRKSERESVEDETASPKSNKPKTASAPASTENMGWREIMDMKNNQKVFVGGIPFSVDLDTLQSDFAECGEVWDFAYPKNEQGGFKGMAFFTFKTMDGVKNALAYDGTDYWGRTLKVGMATPLSTASRDHAKGKGRGGKAPGKGKGKK